jgi:hypothetical protein
MAVITKTVELVVSISRFTGGSTLLVQVAGAANQ